MIIRAVHVRHYRSIAAAGLAQCEELNVLIGKNNAGKSNVLSAIALALSHLRAGKIARPWNIQRPQVEFHRREITRLLRIGLEFSLSSDVNKQLRDRLTKEAPHLDRSIEQIGSHSSAVFIIAGGLEDSHPYLFLEQLAVGKLNPREGDLSVDGIKLLSVTTPVARELSQNAVSAQALTKDLETIEEIRTGRGPGPAIEYMFQQPKERRSIFIRDYLYRTAERLRPEIETRLSTAANLEEAQRALSQLAEEIRDKIDSFEKRETKNAISAFAGDALVPPAYAGWFMQQFGSTPMMYIREVKRPIGREEAQTLLSLKVTRGGPERLKTLQQTIQALLGVSVDAFQSDGRSESAAEMDVDDFLVEANGAGIREALRLILDLELKEPNLVLIEEPEVHLHAGLARVVANYLKEKSHSVQMFITTHSTDFVDFMPFQTVFLVSRDEDNGTTCQPIEAGNASLTIPAELGLRLSTVFMFDRLVFVEGPTDEAVLRELARKLEIDLTKNNVGFIYMEGTRNFAHFAADATLDFLSRRQVRLHFIVDRDERDDVEVTRMIERLGDRAKLKVFDRREIENYLLRSEAVRAFIEEKLRLTGSDNPSVSQREVEDAIETEAVALKDEVVRLKIENRMLKPIFLHTRAADGSSIEERLRKASEVLAQRQERFARESEAIFAEVQTQWPRQAVSLAPGSKILEKVAQRFGARFQKDKGDTERLARFLPKDLIPLEIQELLRAIVTT